MEFCSNCFHSHMMLTESAQAGQLICRRNPPIPHPLMQQNRGTTSLQIIPLWSIVTKNDVCGEWVGVDEDETPEKPAEKPKIILD